MPLKVWNGSAWTLAAKIQVWNGSSWVPVTGKVWNGSSWVQFSPGVTLTTINLNHISNYNDPSSYAEVGVELLSSGTANYYYSDSLTPQTNFLSFSWLLSGSNSEYYAFMDTPTFGSFSFGTVNSNLVLSTGRQWTVQQAGAVGSNVVSSTLRLRTPNFTDILSVSVDMSAELF